MADNISFTVNNPFPIKSGAAVAASGGAFTAATYSFLVVAWYRLAETDNDFAGWTLAGAAEQWDGVALTLNQQVTLPFTKATKTIGSNTPTVFVDHYAVYIQTAATFDLTAAAGKCTAITITDTSATAGQAVITAETSTGSVTFTGAYTVKTTGDGQIDWRGVPRDNAVTGFSGSTNKRSYATDLTFGGLEIEGKPQIFSGTMASWHFLLKCQKNVIPLKLIDLSSTSWVDTYYGTIHSLTYPGSTGKNLDLFNIGFKIDSEDEA